MSIDPLSGFTRNAAVQVHFVFKPSPLTKLMCLRKDSTRTSRLEKPESVWKTWKRTERRLKVSRRLVPMRIHCNGICIFNWREDDINNRDLCKYKCHWNDYASVPNVGSLWFCLRFYRFSFGSFPSFKPTSVFFKSAGSSRVSSQAHQLSSNPNPRPRLGSKKHELVHFYIYDHHFSRVPIAWP